MEPDNFPSYCTEAFIQDYMELTFFKVCNKVLEDEGIVLHQRKEGFFSSPNLACAACPLS